MFERITENTFQIEKVENGVKFTCLNSSGEIVGSITLNHPEDECCDVGGLFVDPNERGKGIASELITMVNNFLNQNKKTGRLINTIKNDAANVYENNGWKKGKYISDGMYGGYEYTYN